MLFLTCLTMQLLCLWLGGADYTFYCDWTRFAHGGRTDNTFSFLLLLLLLAITGFPGGDIFQILDACYIYYILCAIPWKACW